jgi:hypothetical protein
MPKLTNTQLIMLSSAAQRADGAVQLPENLKGTPSKRLPPGCYAKVWWKRYPPGPICRSCAVTQSIKPLP